MNNAKSYSMMLLSFVLFASSSCSSDESRWVSSGDGGEITGTNVQNKGIDQELFTMINLDYPGLEKVKGYYEAGEYYLAAESLLDYYRLRTDVVNPLISLLNVSVTENELKMANDALDYKFYVKNYTAENGESYQFKKSGDTKIDWMYQPVADGEFRSQLYRLAWFTSQGKAYRATHNEDYVKSWIDVYGDFWKQYPLPESETDVYDHYGMYGSLPVAERVSTAANVFFYFINSSNFTPAWLSTFLVSLSKQTDYIQSHPYSGDNNINVEQAFSVTAVALLFPELAHADSWLNYGSTTLSEQVKNQFLEDGFQFEVDLSYHIGVVATFYDALLLAQANNKTDKLSNGYVESMRKATEVLMNLTYPNYTLPTFNDTRATWTENVITRNLKEYVNLFPENENMKWLAYSGKQGKMPEHLTKAFTASGYYVLRNGWDVASTMLIHTNNPTAAWHNQGDNGTFELYHNGRNFFPDSGTFTYNNGSEREWYRSAKQHNTMTLNDSRIADANRNGKFLKLETINNTDILVTENQSYSALKHRRAIFFVDKKFFVFVDEGIGSAAGKVSLNFHLCEGSDSEVVYDSDKMGLHTDFADKNNMLLRSFGNGSLTFKSWTGKVSPNINEAYDRKSYEVDINKNADQTVRFITVIMPVNGDAAAHDVEASFTDTGYSANGASVKVVVDGQTYDLNYTL